MDLTPFKKDIDDLIDEFTACDSSTLQEFKGVWGAKKFSFIFEASPSTNQGFFMQSLYAHCLSYFTSSTNNPLRKKLGGLYCLYCLHQTQPFKPPFKIYLSLEELRHLKPLVVEAKATGVAVVPALVKSMLEKDVFLFGSVGATAMSSESSAAERVTELTETQEAQVQVAHDKLFADTNLERFVHMDLKEELEVDLLKKMSADYALAKENAIKEASGVVSIENIKHIAEPKNLIGDVVGKVADDWDSQKETFFKQIGCNPLQVVDVPENQEGSESFDRVQGKRKERCDNDDDDDGCGDDDYDANECFEVQGEEGDFGQELEDILLLPQMGFDDEGSDHCGNNTEEEDFM